MRRASLAGSVLEVRPFSEEMMKKSVLGAWLMVVAMGCSSTTSGGGGKAKPSGSKVTSTSKANKTSITSQKTAGATKTKTPPKPVPMAKTQGGTTVKPVDPTAGGEVEVESWSFEDVDLDGDGVTESGVAAGTEETLGVWWTSSFQNDDGSNQAYNGFVWMVSEGVGFAIEIPGSGTLLCAESASGASGCVACDEAGTCEEVGADAEVDEVDEVE